MKLRSSVLTTTRYISRFPKRSYEDQILVLTGLILIDTDREKLANRILYSEVRDWLLDREVLDELLQDRRLRDEPGTAFPVSVPLVGLGVLSDTLVSRGS